MNCPKCQARIPAEDFNVQALIGKCPQCCEVFRVDEELGEYDSRPKHNEIKTPKLANIILEADSSVRRMSNANGLVH